MNRRMKAAAKRKPGKKSKAPKSMVYFSTEEKAEAKAELGLSDKDFEVGVPFWVYGVGGLFIVAALSFGVYALKK